MPLKLVYEGTLAMAVHHKQSYPIDFGLIFVADISIEVRKHHLNNEISSLIIFECKDLGTKSYKSDFNAGLVMFFAGIKTNVVEIL